jgi:mRNA-degrading endonuclease RelE of RelBE toxin-antitoxin system
LKVYETPKFQKLRKKLQSASEKEALKQAIRAILGNPFGDKKLKGELKGLRRQKYSVDGQERRLIYKVEKDVLYLLSFGPRGGIYK